MPYLSSRAAALPFPALLFLASVTAQSGDRFVPTQPGLRLTVRDMPGLVRALRDGPLAKVWADADVQACVAIGARTLADTRNLWLLRRRSLDAIAPESQTVTSRLSTGLMGLSWTELHSVEFWLGPQRRGAPTWISTAVLGTAATAPGLDALYRDLVAKAGLDAAPAANANNSVRVGDHPAVFLQPPAGSRSLWLVRSGDWISGGLDTPLDGGEFRSYSAGRPAIGYEVDLADLLRVRSSNGVDPTVPVRDALGLSQLGPSGWRIEALAGRFQESLWLGTSASHGMLGALLSGTGPLPPQPLPEGALLQIRCAVDPAQFATSFASLLTAAGVAPDVPAPGAEDLVRAWTGGIALAIVRPAVGALTPRLYASFGVADATAFRRWFTKITSAYAIPVQELPSEGGAAWQLKPEGVPPAFQPALWLHDGTLHVAESAASLRALWKAVAAGAPVALDPGSAPRPEAKGDVLPNFELTYDCAAIHSALQTTWLPLLETLLRAQPSSTPLFSAKEMPPLDAVLPHLGRGRGVLQRQPDRIALHMCSGTGGPLAQCLLSSAAFYIMVAPVWGIRESSQALGEELARHKATALHKALAAFASRTGRPAASLGELLAGGNVPADVLLVEGDDAAQVVEHEGRLLGKSSFCYFPAKTEVQSEGRTFDVELVSYGVARSQYRWSFFDRTGTEHGCYFTEFPQLEKLLKQ